MFHNFYKCIDIYSSFMIKCKSIKFNTIKPMKSKVNFGKVQLEKINCKLKVYYILKIEISLRGLMLILGRHKRIVSVIIQMSVFIIFNE